MYYVHTKGESGQAQKDACGWGGGVSNIWVSKKTAYSCKLRNLWYKESKTHI